MCLAAGGVLDPDRIPWQRLTALAEEVGALFPAGTTFHWGGDDVRPGLVRTYHRSTCGPGPS